MSVFKQGSNTSLYGKDMQNPVTSKAFRKSGSQMIHKIAVFENFAKITRKQLCWSSFLIQLKA